MKLRTLKEANLSGKTVLVRVDFNVPIENGTVADKTRLEESLPTLRYLLKKGAKVILISHLGRPKSKKDFKDFSLEPVAISLSRLLKRKVHFVSECVGPKVENALKKIKCGEIVLLENTRFHPEDSENKKSFAKQLAKLADIFVNDAFGTSHRAHASVVGVAQLLPSYAGLLVQKEIDVLTEELSHPREPVCLIVGGAKMETKIPLFKSFVKKTDIILVGGGIANTFLAAAGYNIGKSLYERDKVNLAQEIMLIAEKLRVRFVLPKDVLVASKTDGKSPTLNIPVQDVEGDMRILDIGKWSIEHFLNHIEKSKTVFWNGPMGMFEYKQFENGTKAIAKYLAQSKHIETILGGGDTLDALKAFKIKRSSFFHVSTGGGAMLTFLTGAKLPGIEVLKV